MFAPTIVFGTPEIIIDETAPADVSGDLVDEIQSALAALPIHRLAITITVIGGTDPDYRFIYSVQNLTGPNDGPKLCRTSEELQECCRRYAQDLTEG